MALVVGTNAFLEVNGVQLAGYATKADLNYESEQLDATAFGSTTKVMKGGLLSWSIDVDFLWNSATSGPQAVLWSIVGTTSCVEFRNVNVCSTVINPSFSGIATVVGFPQTVQIGQLIKSSVKFNSFSALSRASSS